MKDEINSYHISNPDGADKTVRNEGKQSYSNDNPRFIKENSSKGQSEWDNSVSENFGSEKKGANQSGTKKADGGVSSSSGSSSSVSSATSSASASASAASASTAASAASAVGGSIGAIAGSVAASVVAAAVVVVAFVSTLTINLVLMMATMHSLIFNVELKGAQEEDFATPIYAILSDDNGVIQKLEINADTLMLTFDDLEPGKEYTVTVKNEEKEFFKKSYFTATEEVEQGRISVRNERGEVFVSVEDVELKGGEYYTLIAKDENGNVVFAKDSVEQNAEFRFTVDKTTNLSFTLSVGGKVYAVEALQVEIERDPEPIKPEYDYQNPTWTWAGDYSSATVTVNDLNGGEPLKITAGVQKKRVAATCEENGYVSYIATAEIDGHRYEDSKQSVENAALGHDYIIIAATEPTCDEVGISAHYYCEVCGKFFDENKNETTLEDLIVPAMGHDYGELNEAVVADCEHGGNIAYYYCEVCGKYFNEDHIEVSENEVFTPALAQSGDPVMLNSSNISADLIGKKVYLMAQDGSVGVALGQSNNTSSDKSLYTEFTISAIDGTNITLMSPDGYYVKKSTGTIAFNNTNPQAFGVDSNGYIGVSVNSYTSYSPICSDGVIKLVQVAEFGAIDIYMFLIVEPSHTYGTLIPSTATCEEGGCAAHYYCEVCGKYFDENKNETTLEDLIVPATGHDYGTLIPSTATCEEGGYAAHYECLVCHKLFDENKNETTLEDLIVPANGHTYGELNEAVVADCEHGGNIAYYYCEVCGKYFNADYIEVSENDVFTPALVSSTPTLITSSNISLLSVGDKVKLATKNGVAVCIGATNNTATDGTYSLFYVESISGNDVVLYYVDGGSIRYLNANKTIISFDANEPTAVTVGNENAPLGIGDYNISNNNGIKVSGTYMYEAYDAYVHMYLVPDVGHTYGELNEAVVADCEHGGNIAYYYCEVCGKYFNEDHIEVSENEVFTPALAQSGDPVMLNSSNISADLIGKKVYLMAQDGSVGVALGQSNNTSSDKSLYTEFTISAIDGTNITLMSPDGYYVKKSTGTIAFNNTNPQAFGVDSNGYIGVSVNSYTSYSPICSDGVIKLVQVAEFGAIDIYMFLIVEPSHTYGALIPSTATCDEAGISAHYYCEVCGKYFDENKNETTLEDLIVPATGHDYGEPVFEWTEIGDGYYTATAKVFCSHDSNHYIELPDVTVVQGNYEFTASVDYNGESYNDTYYLDNPYEPTPSDGVELDIGDGNIVLYADGYEQNGAFTAFDNTENSRYIISGSREDDTPLRFIAKTYNGESVADGVNYYVDFDNAEILGDSWATALVIYPYSPINIYANNVGTGTTTIKGYNHVAFSVQGDGADEHVNVYIESVNEFDSFDCGDSYNGTRHLYDGNANISVYMNGTAVGEYGN